MLSIPHTHKEPFDNQSQSLLQALFYIYRGTFRTVLRYFRKADEKTPSIANYLAPVPRTKARKALGNDRICPV